MTNNKKQTRKAFTMLFISAIFLYASALGFVFNLDNTLILFSVYLPLIVVTGFWYFYSFVKLDGFVTNSYKLCSYIQFTKPYFTEGISLSAGVGFSYSTYEFRFQAYKGFLDGRKNYPNNTIHEGNHYLTISISAMGYSASWCWYKKQLA